MDGCHSGTNAWELRIADATGKGQSPWDYPGSTLSSFDAHWGFLQER
jgi:hypothetical protein